ncbi:MAG: hypothetical protein JO141_24410 [Bradyrhizobium sp.]|nr:hypothetical protein [Bradyrhizobium sp.]
MPFSSPDDNLAQFYKTLADFCGGGPSAGEKGIALGAFFCEDAPGPPQIPAIGITNHGPHGPKEPYFLGQAQIKDLWRQFYTSFPDDFYFQPTNIIVPGFPGGTGAPVFSSNAPVSMRAVQCDLKGTLKADWYQDAHVSPPLSHIHPRRGGPHHKASIAACAVFAYDNKNLITHLWIYMDRYKLQTDLAVGSSHVVAAYVKGFHQWLDALKPAP